MLTLDDLLIKDDELDEKHSRTVVRLATSYWSDSRGLYMKKSLTYLKRKCEGYNLLLEDVSQLSAEDVSFRIVNLDDCDDGIYEVVVVNISRDWETGYVDDYDYKLIPYTT